MSLEQVFLEKAYNYDVFANLYDIFISFSLLMAKQNLFFIQNVI